MESLQKILLHWSSNFDVHLIIWIWAGKTAFSCFLFDQDYLVDTTVDRAANRTVKKDRFDQSFRRRAFQVCRYCGSLSLSPVLGLTALWIFYPHAFAIVIAQLRHCGAIAVVMAWNELKIWVVHITFVLGSDSGSWTTHFRVTTVRSEKPSHTRVSHTRKHLHSTHKRTWNERSGRGQWYGIHLREIQLGAIEAEWERAVR